MPVNFTKEEVFHAYKKLKNYFYHDNTSQFIRKRIADFENSITDNNENEYTKAFWLEMEKIAKMINNNSNEVWKTFFKKNINYSITPKSFKKNNSKIITNKNLEENIILKRINVFIDADIIVHIISVLWLIRIGPVLEKLIDQDSYAYKLEITSEVGEQEESINGMKLYKPYFIQYQTWRDNAIKTAEQLFENKKDLVILSLDIKDYFNSVRLNLPDLQKFIIAEGVESMGEEINSRLFELLSMINSEYTHKISKIKKIPQLNENETILPIGLLSSGILGNFYLRDFDKEVKEALNPAYYGRYVDDLLFVLTNVSINSLAISPINYFLEKYFVGRDLFIFDNPSELSDLFDFSKTKVGDGYQYSYKYNEPEASETDECRIREQADRVRFAFKSKPDLLIQSKKVVLQDLDSSESPAILNNFKKNIDKNRSEFRFLPDEDEAEKEFEEEAVFLRYNDSVNKIRSIEGLDEDKYGASKYLTGKIFATSLNLEKADSKTSRQILTFFRGLIGLNFHSLWEKVATFFLINNLPDEYIEFYRQSKNAIEKIIYTQYDEQDFEGKVKEYLAKDLERFLTIAMATPLAYNLDFLNDPKFDIENKELGGVAKSIRYSNMFRHAWIGLPAINYTNYLFENNGRLNLLRYPNIDENLEVQLLKDERNPDCKSLELNDRLSLLAPKYVRYHEINILHFFKVVESIKTETNNTVEEINTINDKAFNLYWNLNNRWRQDHTRSTGSEINKAKEKYFSIYEDVSTNSDRNRNRIERFVSINDAGSRISNEDKKIAVANVKVEHSNLMASVLGKPNTGKTRRKELFDLINSVEEAHCDLCILPEVSIPYQWLSLLAYQVCRRNIGYVAGLEHWINQHKFAFNFMVTILPIKKNGYNTCLINVRLKNHYSHEEKKLLKGYRLIIPSEVYPVLSKTYNLFHWRGAYFSTYNCFELADIQDRGIFKSKIDFIIASEYNKDVNYFSEIAGSWVRDMHCYFIQVNSSDYGDSRILQPAQSYNRDLLQVKGGETSIVMIGILKIKSLRCFQLMEYDLQKDQNSFKPTPPDFDRKNVLDRINNKRFWI
ncbi:RNA-directed DNA polymerase [Flavihumibacter sp. CACIAM 22H1]|uniref:RNA-directed DNA polymerase n=1 Tax=Flavihumibacter sp. CACIAM 22H1 TaxID=1812911 RepID=UPI0007A7D09D|nr:RNA-directed DNA polymerase [Flavihumibacter sp. CACIAM 22H1]KYP15853.1 MAG: hypothetical protein A1D16_10560 [Flavihumibacter sp. CACIAM 22H1]